MAKDGNKKAKGSAQRGGRNAAEGGDDDGSPEGAPNTSGDDSITHTPGSTTAVTKTARIIGNGASQPNAQRAGADDLAGDFSEIEGDISGEYIPFWDGASSLTDSVRHRRFDDADPPTLAP